MFGPRDCEQIWDALSAYSDGTATRDQAARVEDHLSRCGRCSRDLNLLRRVTPTLLKSDPPVPPGRLREEILAATVYRPSWIQKLRTSAGIPLNYQWGLGGAAACASLAIVLISSQRAPLVAPINDPSPQAGLQRTAALPPEAARAAASPVRADAAIPAAMTEESAETLVGDPVRPSKAVDGAVWKAVVPEADLTVVEHPVSRSASPSPIPALSMARRAEAPETERAAPSLKEPVSEPRIVRTPVDPPVTPDSRSEPLRVARAEDRPLPPPAPEVREMQASATPGQPAAYTMEAKSSLDPGAVASLADLRRTMQREPEEEPAPANFRMNDRRELRLAVHTSRF